MNSKTVTIAISGFFAGLTAWLGTLAIPVYILVGCNVIDYITGIMASRKRGEKVYSEIGFMGILKKICQWILVIVGWMLDVIIEQCVKVAIPGFHVPVVVALFVAFWLVANEMLSILENIVCEDAEPVMALVQMNTMLLKNSWSILRYSSLTDEKFPESNCRKNRE